MPTVRAIHVSPVKSLRLMRVDAATVTPAGIPGDREFLLVDEGRRLYNQIRSGALAQVESAFDGERLELRMPDGEVVGGVPGRDGAATIRMYGRPLAGHWVVGPWAQAVSELVGKPLRLLWVDQAGAGLDAHAVSMLSAAAVDRLAAHGGHPGDLDARRFRPTLLLEGCPPHAEDEWLGRRVRAGDAVLDVAALDMRCAITTRNPLSGERDADTLRWIAESRPRTDGEICFGVYADVVEPGAVRVGDAVEPAG